MHVFFFTSSFVQIATRVTPRNTRSLLNQGVVYVFRGRLSSGLPTRAFDRSNSRNKCSLRKQFETTQYSPPTIFHHHLLYRYRKSVSKTIWKNYKPDIERAGNCKLKRIFYIFLNSLLLLSTKFIFWFSSL